MLLFSISGAFRFTQEPDKPTKVVENGVNNKNVRLAWDYALDANEVLSTIEFEREEIEGGKRVLIASSFQGNAFNPKNNMDRYYRAELPAQLTIFNVDNVKEYKYNLEFRLGRNSDAVVESSTVVVEVYGK